MKSIEAGDRARPRSCAPVNDQVVIEHTRRWISSFVIGLGLCPFARRVFDAGRIRYAISHSRDKHTLSSDLAGELHLLLASPSTQIETTLLIHPHVLADFLDYNDFLGVVDQLLEELRLCGTIQVASFHPQYRFSGTEPNAAENYTNRSPYPMLHLLRETSVSQATDASGGTIVAIATLPSSHAISAAPTASSNISRRRRQPLARCFASGAVASAWLHAWPRFWNSTPMASRWTAHWCARLGVSPPTSVCRPNSCKAVSFPRATGY